MIIYEGSVTFKLVKELKHCGSRKDLQSGKRLHSTAKELRLHHNIYVANTLISMYSRCGDALEARRTFDAMTHRDVVSWTALMAAYMENREPQLVLRMFRAMDCEPNRVTLVVALKACIALLDDKKVDKETCAQEGILIHKKAIKLDCERDKYVASTLINMYSKSRKMSQAREIFNKINNRDAVVWNILIRGYVENGYILTALEVFTAMDCKPNASTLAAALKACTKVATDHKLDNEGCLQQGMIIHRKAIELTMDKVPAVATTLVDMYSKCGDMKKARQVFDGTVHRDVVLWTALIVGYVDNKQYGQALRVFNVIDCTPDRVALTAGLRACAGLAAEDKTVKETYLKQGITIHKTVKERGYESDIMVSNTLVDMYCKCGDLRQARDVFDGILHRCDVSWNSLLLGYIENGESSLALDLFTCMDCAPNHVTLVAALKACRNLGAVGMGRRIHFQVCMFGWEEEGMLATSLVDLYCKCSNMTAAENVFGTMHTVDIATWNSLIGGYSSLGNTSHVFRLVKELQECGSKINDVTTLLTLTACNHAGMVEESQKCFRIMVENGIKPNVEHYACMVDMLGRANRLREALLFVKEMPMKASLSVWMALLSACRKWSNLEVGKAAFDALVEVYGAKESVPAAYVLMRGLYESFGIDPFQSNVVNQENGRQSSICSSSLEDVTNCTN